MHDVQQVNSHQSSRRAWWLRLTKYARHGNMAASSEQPTPEDVSKIINQQPGRNRFRARRPNYRYIHRKPLPREIHSLPVLIPHNPLSLVAVALSYLTCLISPPPPQQTCKGYFSPTTASVHITDPTSIRMLWEMGFFGKGSLSRSEPTWLATRQNQGATSEEVTYKRRDERRELKLERARKEQEAVQLKLKEESAFDSRVVTLSHSWSRDANGISPSSFSLCSSDGKLEVSAPSNPHGSPKSSHGLGDIPTPPLTSASSQKSSSNGPSRPKPTSSKSVRFSPTIEAREFDLTSPTISPIKNPGPSPVSERTSLPGVSVNDQEHLQLSQEEAFFLAYAIGALEIYADGSDVILPISSLLDIFRRHSYFPPRSLSVPVEPDDPFMVSYAAYHHYRSLGWIVRCGVKFSVDYLLYKTGPAMSHAEFAVAVLPAFPHPYWSETTERDGTTRQRSRNDWWWLNCVNRVQTQVRKSLLLCYVEVPPPLAEDEKHCQDDPSQIFSRYQVRDISVKRWVPNRSRD